MLPLHSWSRPSNTCPNHVSRIFNYPRVSQTLPALFADSLLVVRVQRILFDGQAAPKMIEQNANDFFPLLWCCRCQRCVRVLSLPRRLVTSHFIDRQILKLKQTALFQIRRRDTPATFEVSV